MDLTEFVLAELPSPPARVLEVGCGSGELATTLAATGYEVLAVDPNAPPGPLFRRTTIEDFNAPISFDAVVASRSLHHVDDLAAVLDKISALVRPGGMFVLDEFGWERLDAGSAAEVGIDLEAWREEHQGLHTATAMLGALETRFEQRSLSWRPYLYREARQVVDEAAELELIGEGRIEAIGFRYVGVR